MPHTSILCFLIFFVLSVTSQAAQASATEGIDAFHRFALNYSTPVTERNSIDMSQPIQTGSSTRVLKNPKLRALLTPRSIEKPESIPNLDVDDIKTSSSIDREAIRRVVRRNVPAILKCYRKELNLNKNLRGKIVVEWDIANEGRVVSTRLKSNSMPTRRVADCIRRLIATLTFPAPGANEVARVAFPFAFFSTGGNSTPAPSLTAAQMAYHAAREHNAHLKQQLDSIYKQIDTYQKAEELKRENNVLNNALERANEMLKDFEIPPPAI